MLLWQWWSYFPGSHPVTQPVHPLDTIMGRWKLGHAASSKDEIRQAGQYQGQVMLPPVPRVINNKRWAKKNIDLREFPCQRGLTLAEWFICYNWSGRKHYAKNRPRARFFPALVWKMVRNTQDVHAYRAYRFLFDRGSSRNGQSGCRRNSSGAFHAKSIMLAARLLLLGVY